MTHDRLIEVLRQAELRFAVNPGIMLEDERRIAGQVITAPDGRIYSLTICEIVLEEREKEEVVSGE